MACSARIALMTGLVAISLEARAHAQGFADEDVDETLYVPVLREPVRKIVGFDFGLGVFDGLCSGCRTAGGLSLDVFGGIQLGTRVALVGELWTVAHLLPTDDSESGVAAMVYGTVGARLWFTPRTWGQLGIGGAGLGQAGRTEEAWEGGFASTLSIGSELLHRPDGGTDLSLRMGIVDLDLLEGHILFYSIAAVAGYHWN